MKGLKCKDDLADVELSLPLWEDTFYLKVLREIAPGTVVTD